MTQGTTGFSLEDLDYSVCETSESSSSATREGDDKVTQKAVTSYRVTVNGLSDSYAGAAEKVLASDVPTELIMRADGLPAVNASTYYYGGVSNPYLICESKTVEREDINRLSFVVTVNWTTQTIADAEQGQDQEQPPVQLSDIKPTSAFRIMSKEVPIYKDKDGLQCWRLPTGTPFREPVTETVPIFRLIITQFEPYISYQNMIDRSFKLNNAPYRGYGAHHWMTGPISATRARVRLAGGEYEVAKVVYTIDLAVNKAWSAFSDQVQTFGHLKTVPLVDDHAIVPRGYGNNDTGTMLGPVYKYGADGKPISDTITTGYINQEGYLRTPIGQNAPGGGAAQFFTPEGKDRPEYLFFRAQEEISFGFLQI